MVFLAAVLGGGYVGLKVIQRRLQQYQDKDLSVLQHSIRFNERFLGNYETAVGAVLELLPSLKEAIQQELNAEAITEQLRHKPPNKRDLWDNLKIISFTRLVGGAYAYALLSVFMRIQLSILGGRMLKGQVDTAVQKEYHSTVRHLLKEGLHALITVVQAAAERLLSQYSLKQDLSCDGVLQIIQDLRQQVSLPTHPHHSSLSKRRQHFLLQYAMPKETLLHQPEGGVSERDLLLMGTRDMLESGEVGEVTEACVEEVFSQATLHIRHAFTAATQQSHLGLVMARVIPLVCDTSLVLFANSSHFTHVQGLLSNKDLQVLSKNIYEAFAAD